MHLHECCRWGVEQLGGFPRVDRLVELTQRVVFAADASGLPLFAAWRAMPVPDDAPGAQAAVLLHLLREHRAGAHLLAVRASGLTPLEAIIAGPGGRGRRGGVRLAAAVPAGVGRCVRRRVWAEAVTDRIAGAGVRGARPRPSGSSWSGCWTARARVCGRRAANPTGDRGPDPAGVTLPDSLASTSPGVRQTPRGVT